MQDSMGHGWYKFNRIVLLTSESLDAKAAVERVLEIKPKTSVVEAQDEENWDGFRLIDLRDFQPDYSGILPGIIWLSWMRRWHIRGDSTRPDNRRADFFWATPELLMFRGSMTETDRIYAHVRDSILQVDPSAKFETIPFDTLWFLWLFERGNPKMTKDMELEQISQIHMEGGREGFEGKEMFELYSPDVTQSLLSSIGLLLRKNVVGFRGTYVIKYNGQKLRIDASIASGEDKRVRRKHECEIVKAQIPTRGVLNMGGAFKSNIDVNLTVLSQGLLVGQRLVKAYQYWRGLSVSERVPDDTLIDRLVAAIKGKTVSLIEDGEPDLKEWLRLKRQELSRWEKVKGAG